MNIKVNLQDGTPAQFKTEIIDGSLVVTVVSEKEKKDLFPKWEELGKIDGYYVGITSEIKNEVHNPTTGLNHNVFTTSDLAKASLATARVSQTYRRYRKLVGDVDNFGFIKCYGLLYLLFRDISDWEKFHSANREDLDLISIVEDTVQL